MSRRRMTSRYLPSSSWMARLSAFAISCAAASSSGPLSLLGAPIDAPSAEASRFG